MKLSSTISKLGLALACLSCLLYGQTMAVCYPLVQECGEEFEYWLALNYPEAYGDPEGDHGNAVFCDANLTDSIGRSAVGVRVQLYVSGAFSASDGISGYTDANGHVRLQISKPADWGLDYARCRPFDANNNGLQPVDSDATLGANGRLINPTVLQIGNSAPGYTDIEISVPDHTTTLPGLQAGDATFELYQSGIYDKVMIFVPPFDSAEGTSGERTIQRLIDALQPVLFALHSNGVDTWMFKPHHTYDDLHEQSAELAQAIDYATKYASGTGNGKVSVVGMSTGGLVSRITTARWEDPDEYAWRAAWASANGLPAAPDNQLPVSLLGLIETPLRGANVNADLQQLAWSRDFAVEHHLDSCAAQQMLTTSCLPAVSDSGSVSYPCSSARSQDFFAGDGGPMIWDYTPGWGSGGTTLCQGGPGVWSINDDGYPHQATVVAASNGQVGQGNRCYGTQANPDPRDWSQDGRNVCPYAVSTGDTLVGWKYLKINANNGPDPAGDHVYFKPWDIVPGSKWGTVVDEEGTGGPFNLWHGATEQRGAPTFVAMTSSLDVPGCDPFTTGNPQSNPTCMPTGYDPAQGGLLDRHPSIDDSIANSQYMGTHGRIVDEIMSWLVTHVVVASNTDYVTPGNDDRPGTDGSCELRCGDVEPSGSCYCNSTCEDFDDCCDDYAVYNPAPSDFQGCRPAPVCPDGICDSFSGWETYGSCSFDCPPPPVVCDGVCDPNDACSADCPPPSGNNCPKGICFSDSP